MYFYREGFWGDHHAGAALEDVMARDRIVEDLSYEPFRTSAILNWLVVISIALCLLFAAIRTLS